MTEWIYPSDHYTLIVPLTAAEEQERARIAEKAAAEALEETKWAALRGEEHTNPHVEHYALIRRAVPKEQP